MQTDQGMDLLVSMVNDADVSFIEATPGFLPP